MSGAPVSGVVAPARILIHVVRALAFSPEADGKVNSAAGTQKRIHVPPTWLGIYATGDTARATRSAQVHLVAIASDGVETPVRNRA